MSAKINVALVGFGHLGNWHAQKVELTGLARLCAIVEPFEASREKAQTQYPNVKICQHIEEALPLVDAVVIATPTSTHAHVMRSCLMQGKHVFCEKPMVNTWQEARELSALANRREIVVQAGHSERFHEVWDIIKRKPWSTFVQDSRLMQTVRVAPFKGRATDVDVAADLLIHDLDLVLYLWQDWPQKVHAVGTQYLSNQYDFIQTTLQFAGGRQALLKAARGTWLEERTLELTGAQGVLRVNLFERQLGARMHRGPEVYQESYSARDHLLLEQENFYQSIIKGQRPLVDFAMGAKIVYLIEAIRTAIREQRTIEVVPLSSLGLGQ